MRTGHGDDGASCSSLSHDFYEPGRRLSATLEPLPFSRQEFLASTAVADVTMSDALATGGTAVESTVADHHTSEGRPKNPSDMPARALFHDVDDQAASRVYSPFLEEGK